MKYLLTVIVVLGLLFAGCSSAPSETQSGANADAQAQPAASDSSASSAQATSPATSSASSKAADEIEAFMSKQYKTEYGVVYKITTLGQDAAAPYTSASYFSGGDKIRFDTVLPDVETRSYMVGDTDTNCNKYGAEWVCTESKPYEGDDSYYDDTSSSANFNFTQGTDPTSVSKLPDMTLLDTKTSCYRINLDAQGYVEYCFTSDAIPLYIKAVSSDQSGATYTQITQATSYIRSVPDSMFVPPASPVAPESAEWRDEPSQEELDALMAQYATE